MFPVSDSYMYFDFKKCLSRITCDSQSSNIIFLILHIINAFSSFFNLISKSHTLTLMKVVVVHAMLK